MKRLLGSLVAIGLTGLGFLLVTGGTAGAQSTMVVTQGKGFLYGPWWVAGGPDGGPIPVSPITPTYGSANPCGAVGSVGGDAGAGTVILAQNDGGANRVYVCAVTINTPNPGGVEFVCGPSANGCAIDGGVGSTQSILGNYYFSGPGISNNGGPFAYVCPKAGDSLCVFQDGGIGWDVLAGFGP